MLKRFGVAGVLFAVSAVAPFTAAAQDRNYNNHNQAQWAPQARQGVQAIDPRAGGNNNAQNFRGAYNNTAQDFRGVRNDVRESESDFHADRDDRDSNLRFYNGHNHGPMPYRDSGRDGRR